MAKNFTPKGKIVRRLGVNIFGNPKYDRLLERRPTPPGQHGAGRKGKPSDYSRQLIEKQKVRFCYGLSEKQFRRVFDKSKGMKGITGHNMLILLERRLDNMVYRLGLASTRTEARLFVRHGHFLVNGRKVDIPSYLVSTGDVIEVREKSRKVVKIAEALDSVMRRGIPAWLELERDAFKGTVKTLPAREELTSPVFEEQLIVELYSK
ncbi:MAG: 30S ribosomal protein S4 [Desulfuromonadales bacterium C00003068]|jgi:small subunit ribosomal protein S4|nr:30S ribosomal protein S4 [Deltaproteobacteria bacterium]OEU75068.1 MAG: 30S ribosomal protein S4 [Desulfuromonadales bacterium C00003068]